MGLGPPPPPQPTRRARDLSDTQKAQINSAWDIAAGFNRLADNIGDSRDLDIAKMKMEEAVHWLTAHVVK